MARINYSLWGDAKKLGLRDGYALSDGFSSDIDRVVNSLEWRSGLEKCGGPQNQGVAFGVNGSVYHHYSVTLGELCPGGGWTPKGQVWIAIGVRS